MSDYLLDSSALIEFFEGTTLGAKVCELIEEEEVATAVIAIAEVSDIFARKQKSFDKECEFLERNIRIHNLPLSVCKASGMLKAQHRKKQPSFGLLNALIYLTAQENSIILVTKDNDFKGMKNVMLLT